MKKKEKIFDNDDTILRPFKTFQAPTF